MTLKVVQYMFELNAWYSEFLSANSIKSKIVLNQLRIINMLPEHVDDLKTQYMNS
jgi:hypothetical protein